MGLVYRDPVSRSGEVEGVVLFSAPPPTSTERETEGWSEKGGGGGGGGERGGEGREERVVREGEGGR